MTDELLVSRMGRIGRIRLNRPKALNALNLPMVRAFAAALDDFEADPDILAVYVTGEGERGLCAGGDIRALYDLRDKEKESFIAFWREEYELNARIAAFRKPYVVLMDGLVMGGGVGVSAHGNRRIVTERSRIAMPETGIGFIPDVGGTWLLSRDGGAGVYMALTGAAVGAADAIHVGLADMAILAKDIDDLERSLEAVDSAGDIDAILQRLRWRQPDGIFSQRRALLDRLMSLDGVERIIAALKAEDCEFARAAARELATKSPTSLKVVDALLKKARTADRLETCLVHEFRAACSLLRSSRDLYEGVRAAIVDKDRSPRWSPETLEAVDEARVAAILAGTGDPEPQFRRQSAQA